LSTLTSKYVTLNGNSIKSENLRVLILFIGAKIVLGLHLISSASKGTLW